MFSPTEEAFADLSMELVFKIKSEPQLLRSFLLYHILQGRLHSWRLGPELTVNSIEGSQLSFRRKRGGGVMVEDVDVIRSDMNATNGVIHVIDKVLIPPSLQVSLSNYPIS